MTSDIEGGVSAPQPSTAGPAHGPPPGPPPMPDITTPGPARDAKVPTDAGQSDGSFMTPDFEPADPQTRLHAADGSRRPGWVAGVVGGLLGAALTVATLYVIGVVGSPATPGNAPDPTVTTAQAVPIPDEAETRIGAIAAAAVPSVVTIEVRAEDIDDDGAPAVVVGTGSGIVVRPDGYIVTNHHVIEGAVAMNVVFADGSVYAAEWIGSDPTTDIGVIKVSATDLPAVPLDQLAGPAIGDLAVAVGSPLGLQGGPSVTSGIVSAVDRRLDMRSGHRLYGLIQTDAPIIFGSSGGALLDEEGRLIGLTTAIGVSAAGAEGVGFAIPVDVVAAVVEDIISNGRVDHAYLGIHGETHFVIGDNGGSVPAGARVFAFTPESPLKARGAQIGDVILAVDGEPVHTMDQLVTMLLKRRASETANLVVMRNGVETPISIQFGSQP